MFPVRTLALLASAGVAGHAHNPTALGLTIAAVAVGGTLGGDSGATVTADVLAAVKGPKVFSVKYKRRKGYHKKVGHRQKYTEVKITAINA